MSNKVRVAIVGTGFSGLGMAIRLKQAGMHDFVIFERATDVGGTWRDNIYPGCQCDVPSHLYSFSFRPNPGWSRTYSPQPEIRAYLRRCAEEANVLQHVRFQHEVKDARWDEDSSTWVIETTGDTWTADFLVTAHGGLAEPAFPDITGLDSFAGEVIHSAAWDPDLDLTGKKVAVVGTGASAIQIVPRIQPAAGRLTVFQRTPPWVLPHTDRPISDRERALYARFPIVQKLMRGIVYLSREMLVFGMAKRPKLLEPIRALAIRHMKSSIKDRTLRKKLIPRYLPGCKRLLLSDDYYPALSCGNVDLVTDGIDRIESSAIVTRDGTRHELDIIIFATGFNVIDNPVLEHVHGKGGRTLRDHWASTGMRAYLGTLVDGFPNLFLMTGPNTGIGHTSLVVMAEAQMRFILRALKYMDRKRADSLEVRADVLDEFNAQLQAKMRKTVWTQGGCSSWYLDEQGRNPTLWPDFTWKFMLATRRFEPDNFMIGRRAA
jgi:cation diffusion facilitator CzcD-associated flavoprotein CzcO